MVGGSHFAGWSSCGHKADCLSGHNEFLGSHLSIRQLRDAHRRWNLVMPLNRLMNLRQRRRLRQ